MAADWLTNLETELRSLGAVAVGVADVAEVVASHEWHDIELRVRQWLGQGRHGEMAWLAKPEALVTRLDPRRRYPWIRSAIAAAFPYNTLPGRFDVVSLGQGVIPATQGRHKISRYAHGADYHWVLGKRVERLTKRVMAAHPGLVLRGYLDTGPVLERQWAVRAGLGWIGRNGLLIHPRHGSWVFLTVIFGSEPAPSDAAATLIRDHCGSCRQCIESCPTQALDPAGTGQLDATRCLSYLTIEASATTAPPVFLEHHDGWLFGCDVCQQVCPWNIKPAPIDHAEFAPRDDWLRLTPQTLAQMKEAEFAAAFKRSPLWRPGLAKLKATLRVLTPH